MGKKGAKMTSDAEAAAARLVAALDDVGDVSSRKMFGGVGVFEESTMFGIVDSAGDIFFRAGPSNQGLFAEAGSERHGKMPYYSVPETVLREPKTLADWAAAAIEAAKAAKK